MQDTIWQARDSHCTRLKYADILVFTYLYKVPLL